MSSIISTLQLAEGTQVLLYQRHQSRLSSRGTQVLTSRGTHFRGSKDVRWDNSKVLQSERAPNVHQLAGSSGPQPKRETHPGRPTDQEAQLQCRKLQQCLLGCQTLGTVLQAQETRQHQHMPFATAGNGENHRSCISPYRATCHTGNTSDRPAAGRTYQQQATLRKSHE